MPRHQQKNAINSNQDNVTLPKSNYATTVGPENYNIAKAQEKKPLKPTI